MTDFRALLTRPRDTGELAWMAYGACRGVETRHFFADDELSQEIALSACDRCSVIASCRLFALGRPDLDGVWGGTTAAERRAMWRRAGRRAARDAS